MYFKLILLSLLLISSNVFAYIVVANDGMQADSISTQDLRNVYLKKKLYLFEGQVAEPVGLKDGDARLMFIVTVLRKNEATLNSYWSRLLFTGRANPPRLFGTAKQLMEYIAQTPGTIGYADDGAAIMPGVKIIEVK